MAEQGKTDFRPPEDGEPPPLDRPTDACMLVAALLSALLRLAAQHLQASNLASFDMEAGSPDIHSHFWVTDLTTKAAVPGHSGITARCYDAIVCSPKSQSCPSRCFEGTPKQFG